MPCCAAGAAVLGSAFSHCWAPKPLPQALQLGAGSQACASLALQPPSSAVCAAAGCWRVAARLDSSAANCPPAISDEEMPTLALLPDSTVSAWPIWLAD